MAKLLNCSSTSSPTSACMRGKPRPGGGHLAGRQRPRAGPLDLAVDVLVDDVVVGAAGAAHGDRADQEQREVPGVGKQRRAAGRRARAWALAASAADHQHGHKQQPPADRPVPARKLRIGPQPARQQPVDPMAARRVGDPALALLGLDGLHAVEWQPPSGPSSGSGCDAFPARIAANGFHTGRNCLSYDESGRRHAGLSEVGWRCRFCSSARAAASMRWPGSSRLAAARQTLRRARQSRGSPRRPSCVPLDIADHAAVAAFCRDTAIDLVVVGPEAPLVAGLADDLRAAGIRVFGPTRRRRGSKAPRASPRISAPATASRPPPIGRFYRCGRRGKAYVARAGRADRGQGRRPRGRQGRHRRHDHGRGAGRRRCLFRRRLWRRRRGSGDRGVAGGRGGELLLPLRRRRPRCRSAPRRITSGVGEGDTGPNTGGMGAYSPAPVVSRR